MNIVLIHGGWHGGWAWKFVDPLFTAAGHTVFAPTLTGLGERSHLVHRDIDPDLHVQDVVNVIKWNELENVVLVGHSYGGMIITGVASEIPQKLSALVYLDAFVPTKTGESAFCNSTPERIQRVKASVVDGYLVPPAGFENWSDNPEKRDWLKQMTTPHPIGCFSKGPSLRGKEKSVTNRHYLWCSRYTPSPFQQYYQLYRNNPDWVVHDLPCLHDAMVDAPELVAQHILQASQF